MYKKVVSAFSMALCIGLLGCQNETDIIESEIVTEEQAFSEDLKLLLEDESESVKISGITIQGNTEDIMKDMEIGENGALYFLNGTIEELSYSLPGYRNVEMDVNEYKDEMETIFEELKIATRDDAMPYSVLDGAILNIKYVTKTHTAEVAIYSAYDGKSVYVEAREPGSFANRTTVTSEKLNQMVHELTGWKVFDLEQLMGIDSMTLKKYDGSQILDYVVLSEEETKEIVAEIIRSAEVTDKGACPYNIEVEMYQNGELKYHGWLTGDSCPDIGLETQFFSLDKMLVKELKSYLGETE